MPYQHSRPDQESDRERNEPEPGCVPVSRWRNRRRWFYVAVVAVTLACLGGGWVWWYRANFPIPSRPFVEPTSPNLMTKAISRLWSGAQIQQRDLLTWKAKRETKRLQLAGTIWEDSRANAIIEFTGGGLFLWRQAPWPPPGEGDPAYPARLDGQPWRFLRGVLPKRGFNGKVNIAHELGSPPNLEFPESNWSAHLLCTGNTLFITFKKTEEDEPYPYSFVFNRLRSREN